MLTTSTLSILSLMVIKTHKNSWELSTSLMLIMSMLITSIYPLKDSMFILSKNLMLDSMSLLMIMLSMWTSSMMILASYNMKKKDLLNTLTMITISLLMTLMTSFSVNNLLLFYIMFETSLIPTMLLIILWGNQPERKMASFFIMLYTVTASLPMLMMIMKLMITNYHTNLFDMKFMLPAMMNYSLSWMMLMMAFMVKLPLFSLHMWLPKAHVEAPVAGSMILAAILLKLGGYGMIRMNKLVHQQMSYKSYTIVSISVIGAIITNMMCLRQTDLKALIAYSSVGHMSLLIMSFMSNSKLGQYSSLLIMLTHGLTSSCMFLLTNIMYEKTGSRNIIMMGGTSIFCPMISLAWMLSMSMNMALPPSMNLISEITAMMSGFFIMKSTIMLLMTINFLTAAYSLYLYSTINHGNQPTLMNYLMPMSSINMMTTTSHLWPLMVLVILTTKLMSWC